MTAPQRSISLFELFKGFATIGVLGFGGVAVMARHVIVEQYQWLTEKEYATILGMGQILPGANVVNASVVIGDRFQGPKGSIVCVLGILISYSHLTFPIQERAWGSNSRHWFWFSSCYGWRRRCPTQSLQRCMGKFERRSIMVTWCDDDRGSYSPTTLEL